MTRLRNEIFIQAPRAAVWAVLARLDLLHEYDPGVEASQYTSTQRQGKGAARRSEVAGGYFEDVVTDWEDEHALELELTACSFPVKTLNHRYTLMEEGGGTRVRQVQEYEMKFGFLGRLMDGLVIRRKWNSGVQAFLRGLKSHVEASQGVADSVG